MTKKKLKLELGAELATEIAEGVHKTLTSMFEIQPQTLAFKTELDCKISADISGIVNLIQDHEEGTFIICFPKTTIFHILGRIYRKEFREIDRAVEMGVGELTNIIYGVVKSRLNESGMALKMAIPNIILGHQHTILNLGNRPTMILPFSTEGGAFHVLLTVYAREAAEPLKAAS